MFKSDQALGKRHLFCFANSIPPFVNIPKCFEMKLIKAYSLCLLFSLISANVFAHNGELLSTSFQFMSQQLSIDYDEGMVLKKEVCVRKKCIKRFYERMEESPYQPFLNKLLEHRERLELNDWLFYKLVNAASLEVVGEKNRLHQGYMTWFMLNAAGYDARIALSSEGVPFIYAYAVETMGNVPSFLDNEKRFVNLTGIDTQVNTRKLDLFQSNFVGNKEGTGFVFTLDKMPSAGGSVVSKTVVFSVNDEEHTFEIEADEGIVEMLRKYPQMSELGYVTTTLSTPLKNSLYPKLKTLIDGKSTQEALEVLVSFTRSAFPYKWDWDVYDDDKSMYAEELFFSEYSDHEDRCALFYHLVKDLLDLPMIVVTHYNNNMTIGVACDGEADRKFEHEGREYLICDPTFPSSSSRIGEFPNGMTPRTSTVIGTYK